MTDATVVVRRNFYPAMFWMLIAGGLYATWLRVTGGLGAVTNLSDQFPWGIWVGFDMLCGVGLAAGGFTLCAIVHIFNIEQYKPILRPAILTAFLGYVFVVVALMFDLGRPDRIWHPLVMWNPHSVMFEVAMVRDALHHGPVAGILAGGVRAFALARPARRSSTRSPCR